MRGPSKPKHEKPVESQTSSQDDELEVELEDSFPASDPPQSTQPHSHPGGPERTGRDEPQKPHKK